MRTAMSKFIVFIANRVWLILAIYVGSILLSSLLFAFVEVRTFWDGLWWSVVTSLSIGYGDITPVTASGKAIGITFGHFWIFAVIPMIVTNIIIRVLEDQNAFTDSEQREVIERIKNIEAMLLRSHLKD